MTHYYLFALWDWPEKSGYLEEFDTFKKAAEGIAKLLKEHPDAVLKLIQGKEIVK